MNQDVNQNVNQRQNQEVKQTESEPEQKSKEKRSELKIDEKVNLVHKKVNPADGHKRGGSTSQQAATQNTDGSEETSTKGTRSPDCSTGDSPEAAASPNSNGKGGVANTWENSVREANQGGESGQNRGRNRGGDDASSEQEETVAGGMEKGKDRCVGEQG